MQTDDKLSKIKKNVSEKEDTSLETLHKKEKFCSKMKILFFISIGIIIILIAAIIVGFLMHIKSIEKYKSEISDLEFEKRVLENQKTKLNITANELAKKNIDLNQTNINLNTQLSKAANEEVKRNQTYQTLAVISKEGASLKTTFSDISKGLSSISSTKVSSHTEENRVLEENLNNLQSQLELIKALMDQINLNLDLANQNKELVLNNIEISNKLNQQIINNTALVIENQNLIKEKVSLNNELNNESEKNKRFELKIKELEIELENEKIKGNQTVIIQDTDDEDKKIIEELNKKINEEITKNTVLKEKIVELESLLKDKNTYIETCENKKEEIESEKLNLTENIHNLFKSIELLNSKNSNLIKENIELNSKIENLTIENNILKIDYNICLYDSKKLDEENNLLKIEKENLSKITNQINNSLTICNNKFEIIKMNDTKLNEKLNECTLKVNDLIKNNLNLQNKINNINIQYSLCNNDLNNYKTLYQELLNIKNQLVNENQNLKTKNTQLQNNYNNCNSQLTYYSNLQNDYKNLKEKNSALTQQLYNCNQGLSECNRYYPIMGYDGLTNAMKSTMNEVIVYSYSKYTNFESRAKYISDRINEIYNQAQWGCILAKTTAYYGYYVWYINDLYFTTTYKSIKWIIFGNFKAHNN